MRNEASRTEEPGTTTKRSEVVPLVKGDVAKARVSVENEGRRGQLVSVDTEDPEGEVRYNGAQRGAEVARNVAEVAENDRRRPAEVRIGDPKAAQRRDKRREEAAEGRPKQAPASPEFFGRATSPDSVYETAVKTRTKSRPSETSEAQETTEVSEQPNEFRTPKEYR